MGPYPTRLVSLTPLAPHGIRRVIAWLHWCHDIDKAIADLLAPGAEVVFSPLGAAWLGNGLGAPAAIAGLDAKGTAIFALREDLLTPGSMRELHLRFGERFLAAPPHPLHRMEDWEALWQVVAVPFTESETPRPTLTPGEAATIAAATLQPEWLLSVALAQTPEEADSLLPRLEAVHAEWMGTVRTDAGGGAPRETATPGTIEELRSRLVLAREQAADHVTMELVRGSLRVRALVGDRIVSLPGLRDAKQSAAILRAIEEAAGLSGDDGHEGVLREARLGPGAGDWVVRAVPLDGDRMLRLTPWGGE